MAWLKGLSAYFAWVLAHAAAGALFAIGVGLLTSRSFAAFLGDGLLAGLVYGVAQWLVLRWVIPGLRWWLPLTVAASPISWFWSYVLAAATFTLGGWLGGGFSAILQTMILAIFFRDDRRLAIVSIMWLPAAVLGSLIFYFAYLESLGLGPNDPTRFMSILVGSVGFAAITGFVVALLAGLAPIRTRVAPSSATPRL